MTVRAALPAIPALAGLDLLHRAYVVLLGQMPAAGTWGDVNADLRALLDEHPELELLPLELLAQDIVRAAGDRTRQRT